MPWSGLLSDNHHGKLQYDLAITLWLTEYSLSAIRPGKNRGFALANVRSGPAHVCSWRAITTSVALKRLAIVAGSLTFFLQLLQPVWFGTFREFG